MVLKEDSERIGVYECGSAFHKIGFMFREQPTGDYGIDALIEARDNDSLSGKLIAVQIKSGDSYFKERKDNCVIYRGNIKHYNYWINHSLPVIIVLYSQLTGEFIWECVNEQTASQCKSGWKISIPCNQTISTSKEALYDLANRKGKFALPFEATDEIVVKEILNCFNRPAFIVQFRDECNLGDFDEAIKNTISLINTGKSTDGILIKYCANDIKDRDIKKKVSEIVTGLNYLRKVFAEMEKRGYATKCKCGDPKCKLIFNNDFDFCWLMNDLRLVVLFFADKLAQSVGCDFNVFPEYMEIRECGAKGEKLRECMEEVYLYHKVRLSR